MNSHHREETLFSLVIGVQSCIISVFWCLSMLCHFPAATRRPHGTREHVWDALSRRVSRVPEIVWKSDSSFMF